MAKEQVGLRLDRDLLERVESARGDVPRNRFIERAIEAAVFTGVESPEAPIAPSSLVGDDRAEFHPEPSVRRCPNGCVKAVTSLAVSKCRVCNARLVEG